MILTYNTLNQEDTCQIRLFTSTGLRNWHIKVFRISELDLTNPIISILPVSRLQNMYYSPNTVYHKGHGDRLKYYLVFCYFLYNSPSELFYLASLQCCTPMVRNVYLRQLSRSCKLTKNTESVRTNLQVLRLSVILSTLVPKVL